MLSHSKINYQRKYSPNISDPFKLDSAEAKSERRHLCESDYKVFTGKNLEGSKTGKGRKPSKGKTPSKVPSRIILAQSFSVVLQRM